MTLKMFNILHNSVDRLDFIFHRNVFAIQQSYSPIGSGAIFKKKPAQSLKNNGRKVIRNN